MAGAAIRYPAAVFGYTTGQPQAGGSVAESFVAGGVIVAGSPVSIDTTAGTYGQVVQSAAAATDAFVGIAQDAAAAAGEVVQVALFGHAVARVNTVLAIGAPLQTAASGYMAGGTATAGTTKAMALQASADTTPKLIAVLITRL